MRVGSSLVSCVAEGSFEWVYCRVAGVVEVLRDYDGDGGNDGLPIALLD